MCDNCIVVLTRRHLQCLTAYLIQFWPRMLCSLSVKVTHAPLPIVVLQNHACQDVIDNVDGRNRELTLLGNIGNVGHEGRDAFEEVDAKATVAVIADDLLGHLVRRKRLSAVSKGNR